MGAEAPDVHRLAEVELRDRAVVDAGGRIASDAACRNCGYNLRTMSAEGVCPECGRPVLDTELLRFQDPRWLRRLRLGAGLVVLAFAAVVGGCFVQIHLEAHASYAFPAEVGQTVRPKPDPWREHFPAIILGAFILLLAGGVILATARDRWRADEADCRSRRIAQAAAWATLGWCAACLALYATVGGARVRTPVPISIAAYGVFAAAIAALALGSLGYASGLIARFPSRVLFGCARLLYWFGAPLLVLSVGASVAVGVAASGASGPIAYAMPVYAGPPSLTPGTPTTTHYIIVYEDGAMTRTTTVPASMIWTPSVPTPQELQLVSLIRCVGWALALWVLGVVLLAAALCVCFHRALRQRLRLGRLAATAERAGAAEADGAPA